MRIFPSVPAAIVCGAVGMPLLAYGSKLIERTSASQWLLLPLAIITFLVPFLVSTTDLNYLAKSWRESGLYSMSVKREDFRLFYTPAWIRMVVWFVSSGVSMFSLKALGLEL